MIREFLKAFLAHGWHSNLFYGRTAQHTAHAGDICPAPSPLMLNSTMNPQAISCKRSEVSQKEREEHRYLVS